MRSERTTRREWDALAPHISNLQRARREGATLSGGRAACERHPGEQACCLVQTAEFLDHAPWGQDQGYRRNLIERQLLILAADVHLHRLDRDPQLRIPIRKDAQSLLPHHADHSDLDRRDLPAARQVGLQRHVHIQDHLVAYDLARFELVFKLDALLCARRGRGEEDGEACDNGKRCSPNHRSCLPWLLAPRERPLLAATAANDRGYVPG